MNTTEITNTEDILDSRDIIARIEALTTELQDAHETEGLEGDFAEWVNLQAANGDEEAQELLTLQALAEEASDSPDWIYGETLIRDSHFQDYAQELAEDIGAIPAKMSWPCRCIDWEQATRELKMDYIEVDFAGVSYWIRA